MASLAAGIYRVSGHWGFAACAVGRVWALCLVLCGPKLFTYVPHVRGFCLGEDNCVPSMVRSKTRLEPDFTVMPRRTSKRRTVSKTSTKTQTLSSSPARLDEILPKRCHFKDMPNEIMGIIFGLLNLHDLGSVLCVSKWINVIPFSIGLDQY